MRVSKDEVEGSVGWGKPFFTSPRVRGEGITVTAP